MKKLTNEKISYSVGSADNLWWTGSNWVEPPLLKGTGYCSVATCKRSELSSVIRKLKIAKIKIGSHERVFVTELVKFYHPIDPVSYMNEYTLVLGKLDRVKR